MSFRITALCRTTGRISDLEVTKDDKTGVERKSIFFTVVSDRPYKSTRIVNGKTVVERASDYVFCKATGVLAELIHKHCKQDSGKKTKGDKPIYVSRQLLLSGHLETFEHEVPVKVDKTLYLSTNVESVQIGLRDENAKTPASVTLTSQSERKAVLEFTTKEKFKDFRFVVHDIEFADKAPEGSNTSLLGADDGAISIKLDGEDNSTSSVTDNGNSTGSGTKENTTTMDTNSETANKEIKSTAQTTTVDDGDMPDMFSENITDGNAPF